MLGRVVLCESSEFWWHQSKSNIRHVGLQCAS